MDEKMVQFGGLFSLLSCNQPIDVVTIDLSKEEAEIPSSLYGIFLKRLLIPVMEVYMRK